MFRIGKLHKFYINLHNSIVIHNFSWMFDKIFRDSWYSNDFSEFFQIRESPLSFQFYKTKEVLLSLKYVFLNSIGNGSSDGWYWVKVNICVNSIYCKGLKIQHLWICEYSNKNIVVMRGRFYLYEIECSDVYYANGIIVLCIVHVIVS